MAEVMVEDLAEIPAGARLSAALLGLPLSRVPNDRILDRLRAQARQANHEDACLAATLVELARCDANPTPGAVTRRATADEWATHESRAALRWTNTRAESEHALAEFVIGHLPDVFDAWYAGAIDRPRVRLFEQYLFGLDPEQIALVCASSVPQAGDLTTGQLGALLKRLVVAIDPDAAARWYRRSVRERGVCAYLAPDGTVTITAHGLPADEAQAACDRVERLASTARREGHPGTIAQIRADVHLGLLDGRFHTLGVEQIVAMLIADHHRAAAADGDAPARRPDSLDLLKRSVVRGPGKTRTPDSGEGGPDDGGSDGSGPDDTGPDDTGPNDPGPEDAGPDSSAPGDGGPSDPGPPGAGRPGSGPPDSGPPDSGPPDSGPPDSGPPDSGPPDSGAHGSGSDDSVPHGGGDDRPDDVAPDCGGTTGVPSPRGAGTSDSRGSGAAGAWSRRDEPGTATPRSSGPAGTRTHPADQRCGIEIRIALSTLLGRDDHPGEIPGLGPVPAHVARRCALRQTRAEWRFAVTTASGTHLLSEGHTGERPLGTTRNGAPPGGIVEIHLTDGLLADLAENPSCAGTWAALVADISEQHADYARHLADLDAHPHARLPGRAQRRHTEIRDRTCSFGGVCRRPAHHCDQDHRLEHRFGGPTVVANLGPVCPMDHAVKHRAGWTNEVDTDGALIWLSPLGGRYAARSEFLTIPLTHPSPGRAARSGGTDGSVDADVAAAPILDGPARVARAEPDEDGGERSPPF